MNNGVPLDPRQIDRWVRDMKANDEAYARQACEACNRLRAAGYGRHRCAAHEEED